MNRRVGVGDLPKKIILRTIMLKLSFDLKMMARLLPPFSCFTYFCFFVSSFCLFSGLAFCDVFELLKKYLLRLQLIVFPL